MKNRKDREAKFAEIAAEAQACQICPNMRAKTAVLSQLNGSLQPRILFIAEAPGRQGGDRTRIPMCGDASGRTFNRLLASIGMGRGEIFITNAALCNPHTESGANRPPVPSEVRSCNPYLRRTIDLLDPPVVVTLGAKALAALEMIELHGLTLGTNAAIPVEWYRRVLIPMYHPSPQVLVSRRSLEQQIADWRVIVDYCTDSEGSASVESELEEVESPQSVESYSS